MSVVSALRRPEYTGANRCTPCTVVNVALVALVGVAVAVVSPVVAALVVAVGLALVALRGYVVPYTPQFAPAVAARLPVTFEHGEEGGADPKTTLADAEVDGTAGDGPPTGDEVTAALLSAGVVTGDDRLHLAESFEREWLGAVRELRAADDETLAARVADAAGFTDEATVVGDGVRVGGPAGTTLSRPAAITDTATVEALETAGVPPRHWQPATRPLRLFLPECPVCGGEIEATTRAECCGGAGRVYGSLTDDVLACVDCAAVVHRFPDDGETASP